MHLIAVFFLLVSCGYGQTLNIRQVDRVVDVSQNSQVQAVEWYRGESVRFNAYLWRFNEQVKLPTTATPILKAWRSNDLTTLYINATGELVNAGSGEVRVNLTPGQANLPSNVYNFSYQIWDGTNYMGMAAQGQLRVIWSPAGDSIPYVGIARLNDLIPRPTNGWSNGWIVASSDGGTTTFAKAEQSITGLLAKAGGTMSGSIDFTNAGLSSLDFIDFDAAPTSSVTARRLQWNADRSTLKLGMNAINLDVGQQLFMFAKSQETNTISKGEVVFVFGASGDNPTIKRASNGSEDLSSRTIGIAAENIASNNNGFVVTRGTVYNVDTSAFPQGAPLYLGANGTMQTNLPTAPLHGVFIGVVERVSANAGQIYVAVNNYQELRELSDVNVNGLAQRDLLYYNAASSRWENATLAGLGIATGAPLYAFTESDPVWVAASTGYLTKVSAASIYATGTPIYAVSQTGQVDSISLTGAVRGAIVLAGSGVTQTGNVFNFASAGGGGAGTITNLVSGSARLIITNGAGPEVSFGLDVDGLGDNLGNHEATQDLTLFANDLLFWSDNFATNGFKLGSVVVSNLLSPAFIDNGARSVAIHPWGATNGMALVYNEAAQAYFPSAISSGGGAGSITNIVSGSSLLSVTNGGGPEVVLNVDASYYYSPSNPPPAASGRIDWGTRFEGSVNGGYTRTFGVGLDDISSDDGSNFVTFGAFLYTASTVPVTNTLYGDFGISPTGTTYGLRVRANQASGNLTFRFTSEAASYTEQTIAIAAANSTYTTNILLPFYKVRDVRVQVIMSTTNANNLYRIGISR